MVHFVDATVLISYVTKNFNYEKAKNIIENYRGQLVTGEHAKLELLSYYLIAYQNDENKAKDAVERTLKKCNVNVVTVSKEKIYDNVSAIQEKLVLLNLDKLFHIATAQLLGAKKFFTFNRQLLLLKGLIKLYTGIEVTDR